MVQKEKRECFEHFSSTLTGPEPYRIHVVAQATSAGKLQVHLPLNEAVAAAWNSVPKEVVESLLDTLMMDLRRKNSKSHVTSCGPAALRATNLPTTQGSTAEPEEPLA